MIDFNNENNYESKLPSYRQLDPLYCIQNYIISFLKKIKSVQKGNNGMLCGFFNVMCKQTYLDGFTGTEKNQFSNNHFL